LRWLLVASGVLLVGLYATRPVIILRQAQTWVFSSWWAARFIGLTLPAVFAVDQLIRHPAMTPQTLLRGYVVVLVIVFAALGLSPLVGALHFFIQIAFLLGFTGVCLMLMRKIPSPPIQRTLLVLALAYGYLALTLLWLSPASLYPYPYPDMVCLVVLWYAYETGAQLARSP